jgi:RND superfamily putative drug exporter
MGSRTWWLPSWLDRCLPRISLEGQPHPQPA